MSWHRIDENIYIDGTLVTNAEYQLFIDAMREQGKYYQPDYWISHRFLSGNAQKPILGARQSDAVLFCQWLTRRENREWKYRLPYEQEVISFPIKYLGVSPLGHWIHEQSKLSWVGHVPDNARALDHVSFLTRANTRARIQSFIPSSAFKFDQILDHPLDLCRSSAFDLTNTYDRVKDRIRESAPSRNPILNLFRNLTFSINRVIDFVEIRNRTRRNISPHNRPSDFVSDLAYNLDGVLDRVFPRNLNYILDLTLDIVLDHVRNHSINLARDLDCVVALYTYIDIFTLQERIAGRSPAFEGIRLVKERIR